MSNSLRRLSKATNNENALKIPVVNQQEQNTLPTLGNVNVDGRRSNLSDDCDTTAAAEEPGNQDSSAALREFDKIVRRQKPNVDKAIILKSAYHQSLLRVSWNLIESEILHCPGTTSSDQQKAIVVLTSMCTFVFQIVLIWDMISSNILLFTNR